jgi:uncharacterized membrane protein
VVGFTYVAVWCHRYVLPFCVRLRSSDTADHTQFQLTTNYDTLVVVVVAVVVAIVVVVVVVVVVVAVMVVLVSVISRQ